MFEANTVSDEVQEPRRHIAIEHRRTGVAAAHPTRADHRSSTISDEHSGESGVYCMHIQQP